MEQTGCNITWKIKNLSLLQNGRLESPNFNLGNSKESVWRLVISKSENFIFCYLTPEHYTVNTTLYYEAHISSNGENKTKQGIFAIYHFQHFISFVLNRDKPFRNLLLKVSIRDTSDLNIIQHRLIFRTVKEIETREVSYDIPHFKEIPAKQEFFLRVVPVSQNSIAFELKMWMTNDEGNVKTLHIDISNLLKTREFFLFGKISAEDPSGKIISSVTHFQEFKDKSESVCPFKILFKEDALKNFSTSNHKLRMKFEFKLNEGKSTTWIEESSTLPVNENRLEKVSNEGFEKEKMNLRDDFLCLYVERKHADVVICAQGRKFPAHKTILSARSSVFAAMFNADMSEKESNLVEIKDIDPETLDRLLLFMYSEVLRTEEHEDVLKLYEAADKYQVQTLKDKCSSILKELLDTRNAVEMLILADMHHDMELQNSVETFIGANAKKVFQTEEWKNLMRDEPSLGCKVMYKIWMKKE